MKQAKVKSKMNKKQQTNQNKTLFFWAHSQNEVLSDLANIFIKLVSKQWSNQKDAQNHIIFYSLQQSASLSKQVYKTGRWTLISKISMQLQAWGKSFI